MSIKIVFKTYLLLILTFVIDILSHSIFIVSTIAILKYNIYLLIINEMNHQQKIVGEEKIETTQVTPDQNYRN